MLISGSSLLYQAELLGQVCHRKQYLGNLVGNQEAFLLHARHATFYIFHATFPNTYLHDIVQYGADYKQNTPSTFSPSSDAKIRIEHSRPFRMRKPAHQAQFFRLLSEVLCYIVTGDNDVGFVSKSEWNNYWQIETGMNKPPMYECIRIKVKCYTGPDSMINEEGDLDNESEDSEFENEMIRNRDVRTLNRQSGSSVGSKLSTVARYGSPMSQD